MATVIEKQHLTEITKLFVVSAPRVAHNARPGQFVVLRVSETGERVPISITTSTRRPARSRSSSRRSAGRAA